MASQKPLIMYSIEKLKEEFFDKPNLLAEYNKKEPNRCIFLTENNESWNFTEFKCDHFKDSYGKPEELFTPMCSNISCQVETNLYFCLTCGYKGCGLIQSRGIKDGHALDHYLKEGHSLSVSFDSIKIDEANLKYCDKCDKTFYWICTLNTLKALFISYKDIINARSRVSRTLKTQNKADDNVTKYVGIKNTRNTSFISSCLQLFASNETNLDNHVGMCKKPSHYCLLCQFIYIKNALNGKFKGQNEIKSLDICEFIECIDLEFCYFLWPRQNDPYEFLSDFFYRLEKYQSLGELPNFTDDYEIFTDEKCTSEYCRNIFGENKSFILTLPYQTSISDSFKKYCGDTPFYCACGRGVQEWTFRKIPKYLIIGLLLEQTNIDGSKLVFDNNFVYEPTLEIIGGNYEYVCNILRIGESVITGHYITKTKDCYIDDDQVVLNAEKGLNYLFLYQMINKDN